MYKCDGSTGLDQGVYSADICKRARYTRLDVGSLTLPIVENNNGDHDCNNDQEQSEETEAYPPLLASRASGIDRLKGVT